MLSSQSSTVITYRSGAAAGAEDRRPAVCEVSELEVFSCVLGLEDETALAIVDPAALQVALHADHTLHVSPRAHHTAHTSRTY